MKYQSEIIKEIVDGRGHKKSSIHYESECIEAWVEENKGAYPKLCDYKGEWLYYINEKPIGEFPYVTLNDVTEATIDNVVPYAYKSAILKGQTLVNLLSVSNVVVNKESFVKNIKLNQTPKIGDKCLIKIKINSVFESTNGMPIKITLWNEDTSNGFILINSDEFKVGFEKSFLSTVIDGDYFQKSGIKIWGRDIVNGEANIDIIIIPYQDELENWYIPYFEGMQSVKMPVLTTTGKNLFDKTKVEVNKIIQPDGNVNDTPDYFCSDYIRINKNKSYYKNGRATSVAIYNQNKDFIKRLDAFEGLFTVTDNDCYYIRTNGHIDDLDILQLEEGTQATSYEPHKSNILTVNEDIELRGIDEVKDELNCLTGEVVERITEIVLNGSEKWYLGDTKELTQVFCLDLIDMAFIPNKLKCDKLNTNVSGDAEKIASARKGADGQNIYCLYVALLKTKASTVNELKLYLSQNPITVQYPLATESIKTVDLTVTNQNGDICQLKPIEGTMHLETSSDTIQPLFSGEIPVEATTQNLASFIEE